MVGSGFSQPTTCTIKISTLVVELYNNVLSTHSLLEHTNVAILLDNGTLIDACDMWWLYRL